MELVSEVEISTKQEARFDELHNELIDLLKQNIFETYYSKLYLFFTGNVYTETTRKAKVLKEFQELRKEHKERHLKLLN